MSSSVSAARMSSLSTSTLSQILELTRLKQLGISSPSLPDQIAKNLKTLKGGIDQIDPSQVNNDTLRELKEQFQRLVKLSTDLGIRVEGVTTQVGKLVDAGEDDQPVQDEDDEDALAMRPMSPHMSVNMAERYRDQLDDDEETMQRANDEVLQMQKRMIDDQDQALDSLSSAIARQHQLSLHISSELEAQEGLLDDTDAALDRTDANLRRASNNLSRFTQKAKSTGSTGLIVLLVVILVILITVFRR